MRATHGLKTQLPPSFLSTPPQGLASCSISKGSPWVGTPNPPSSARAVSRDVPRASRQLLLTPDQLRDKAESLRRLDPRPSRSHTLTPHLSPTSEPRRRAPSTRPQQLWLPPHPLATSTTHTQDWGSESDGEDWGSYRPSQAGTDEGTMGRSQGGPARHALRQPCAGLERGAERGQGEVKEAVRQPSPRSGRGAEKGQQGVREALRQPSPKSVRGESREQEGGRKPRFPQPAAQPHSQQQQQLQQQQQSLEDSQRTAQASQVSEHLAFSVF